MIPDEKLNSAIEQSQQQSDAINQFAVAQVPFHTHNGADSPPVSIQSINGYLQVVSTAPTTAPRNLYYQVQLYTNSGWSTLYVYDFSTKSWKTVGPIATSAQTYSPTAASTATLDLSLSNEHRIQMPAGNITIALSNDTGAQKFIISITQDSSGSRTVTWFSTIRWAGGSAPTLTTTANKRDTFGFVRTGTATYDGYIVGQNV